MTDLQTRVRAIAEARGVDVTDADRWQVCPRCGGSSPERFYGPCTSCRADLIERERESAPPRRVGGALASLARGEPIAGGSTVPSTSTTVAPPPPEVSTPSAAGYLRRQPRRFRVRPTEWAAVASTLHDQLAELGPRVERVYLVGERPGGGSAAALREWAGGPVPEGWEPDGQLYAEGMTPTLRYRRVDGPAVELLRASIWFGDEELHGDDGAAALALLGELVAEAFDGGELLSTPASTGRFLLMRSLGRKSFPVLDADTQELIRSTAGQGRIELRPPAADRLWELVEYDGRLMYAGCVRELGHGVPTHDRGDTFDGFTRGRYRVTFTVPAGWDHVGLLGVNDGDGWRYPSTPGEQCTTWADACEVRIALDQGWDIRISERLLFPEWRGRPLDQWADKLKAIRGRLLNRAAVGSIPPEVGRLAASGVRSILLHGIGALHGGGHRVTRTSTEAGDVPADAGASWRMEGDVHVWSEAERQAWPEMAHPEWSAAIWARARARLLVAPCGTGHRAAGALSVAGSSVVAFRTDAIYLDHDPGWADDGAVGRLRRVGTVRGPMSWPVTSTELLNRKAKR